MSYKSSNLYASRIFEEHPLALWAIDEDINFVSLISSSAQTISDSDWDFINSNISGSFDVPVGNPIDSSAISSLYRVSSSSEFAEFISNEILYSNNIDELKGTVCFNTYMYIPTETLVEEIHIGFKINGVEYYSTITSFNKDRWNKIEHTANLIDSENIKAFIRFKYGVLAGDGSPDTSVVVSGISVGQWSESFNSFDTGTFLEDANATVESLITAPGNIKCAVLDPYGFNDSDTGYLIQYNGVLLAETSGTSMVYGSKNNVSILSKESSVLFESQTDAGQYNSEYFEAEIDAGSSSSTFSASVDGGLYSYLSEEVEVPSLIFPGKGFLNKSGIYSNITAEFWMRVNNESTSQVRVFGPIKSNDGIYVGADFITVRVGKYVKSYFIGQWYRPMLVHFGQTLSEIYLMINGEKVISISIDSLDMDTFPNSDQDYLGFFGHLKLKPFEVDVFSIHPYIITEQVAKRRFVYGQGVGNQEQMVSSAGGDLTYVDFPYSGYSSTISYPDRTPWTNGYSNNVKVTSNGISPADLQLPNLLFTNKTASVSFGESEIIWSNFEYDNFDIQDEEHTFIKMLPNNSYSNIDSTIYFSKLNVGTGQTKSIYSVIKTGTDVETYQSVLYLSNATTTNYFEVKVESGSIQYVYNDSLLHSEVVNSESYAAIGFDIDQIRQDYSQTSQFLSNLDNVALNFGGKNNSVFSGKIFNLTLNNNFFLEKDQQFFGVDGFALLLEGSLDYIGSYTLIPKASNTTVYLDIASIGYWETSLPLSYFGKYINKQDGTRAYDLDMIQFDIDKPETLYSEETQDSTNYHNSVSIDSFITLQTKENVGVNPYTSYVNTEYIGNNRVLDFDSYDSQIFEDTKFDVCGATVIFPPKDGVDFNDYYITVHLLVKSHGIFTENIVLKKMSLSSIAIDENAHYRIGTPTGRGIELKSKVDGVYEYKAKNPVIIDTESSPYLYLHGNSGVGVLPWGSNVAENSISFVVNETLKSDFRMVGFQMYLSYNKADEFESEIIIGRLSNIFSDYTIYLTPEADKKRAKVRLVNSLTDEEITDAKYFLNGSEVSSAYITPFKWNSLIVSLQDSSINFFRNISGVDYGVSGNLDIYPGIRVNNVAAFSDINEIKLSLTVEDVWLDALSFGGGTWESLSLSANWVDALNQELIPVTVLSIDGESVFDTYAGLSYIIGDDNSILSVSLDSVDVLNDTDWTTFEYKPI